jgi:ubiquitin-activating enzyme E1
MDKLLNIDMYNNQIETLGNNQIETLGNDANNKILTSSVCIIGVNSDYSLEVAKNLILCGINTLYLFDTKKSNIDKIKELNLNTNIIVTNSKKIIKNSNVLIVINKDYKTNISYNNFARENNIKFICLNSHKFCGHIFVDAGIEHLINDISSQNYEDLQIINIDNDGIVITNGHEFKSDITIEIYNVQGLNINFLLKEWEITIINKFKFKLNNFEKQNFTFLNGSLRYIPIPKIINHYSLETFNTNIFKNFKYENDENIAVISIMGSLVASETLKLLTNKYIPITQFFTWEENNISGTFKEKINDTVWFIVGCGAIGCELLKILSFLNVKKIIITDPNIIKKTNLPSEFLFRLNNIGKNKSEIASNRIKNQNSKIEIEYFNEKVSFENKGFTDNIFKNNKITGIFTALNNINGKKFMDEQCFNYNKPLFESNILGIKGNMQPIIPFITDTYSNTTEHKQEKTFPICVIKNFPNEITHTINWAIEQFEFFNRAPKNLKLWLENKHLKFPKTTDGVLMNNDIYLFSTKYKVTNWNHCITWALDMFYENYNYNIKQLLHNFPKETLTSEGTLFWACGKRYPSPLIFDINNQIHLDYIESTVKLLCNCLNLSSDFSFDEFIEEINKYEIKEFIPNSNKIIASNDQELENNSDNTFLELNTNYNIETIIHNENNIDYYLKWLTIASNLRAINYEISPVDIYTTKKIVEKIKPVIITSASLVSGLIILEMFKYLENVPLEKYKSTFVNLADNLIIDTIPIKAPNVTICGNEFNSWFKFNHNDNCTLNEFKEKYEEIFKSPITMIAFNTTLLFSNFTDCEENMNKKLSDVLLESDDTFDLSNQIELIIMCEDETLEIPPIICNLL